MHELLNTVLTIFIIIGIFWYIYDARRKYRQTMTKYAAAQQARSTYRQPYVWTLEEVDELNELGLGDWHLVHGNPFKSSPRVTEHQQTLKPIRPCYRRNSRPPRTP